MTDEERAREVARQLSSAGRRALKNGWGGFLPGASECFRLGLHATIISEDEIDGHRIVKVERTPLGRLVAQHLKEMEP